MCWCVVVHVCCCPRVLLCYVYVCPFRFLGVSRLLRLLRCRCGVSIDSTVALSSYGVGRYINHSRHSNNLSTIKVLDHNCLPHLCFVALKDIPSGTELLFDYGDRANAEHFTWLNE